MLSEIEQENNLSRKSRLLYLCYQTGKIGRSELMAFLSGQVQVHGQTSWGRYCSRLKDLAESDGRIDVEQLLTKLNSDFIPAREKMQLLHLHLCQVGDLEPIARWIEKAAKSSDAMLRIGAGRIQSLMNMHKRQAREELDYDGIDEVGTPESVQAFLDLPRNVKLFWLMRDQKEDTAREAFLYRNALELLQLEEDEFILSNLVKKVPDAILWSEVLDFDLIDELIKFQEHENLRVQTNLLEGMEALMAQFRYRGKLYPLFVKATESHHPRVKSTALRVRYRYAPSETLRQVNGWLERIEDLEALRSIRWLLKSLPELHDKVLPEILRLEERLLLGPEFYEELQ